MKIDGTNPIVALEGGSQNQAPLEANGSLTALHHTVAAAQVTSSDRVLSMVAPDGKSMIYRTVDAKGFVVEQIPSQQIVAMRQDMESLLAAAEREHAIKEF